jgi:hypothetical protein
MTIGAFGYEISEENILSECEAFGLSEPRAREIMREVEAAVLTQFPAALDRSNVAEADKALAMRSIARLDERPNEGAIERLMRQMNGERDEEAQGDRPHPAAAQRG